MRRPSICFRSCRETRPGAPFCIDQFLSMYRRPISLTLVATSATSSPLRLTVVNRVRAALNEHRSVFSSSVHHRLAYGDGRALATCSSRTPLAIASNLSTAISKSSLVNYAFRLEPPAIFADTSPRIFFQSVLSYIRFRRFSLYSVVSSTK
jgi:hypothetical protein